MAGARSWAIVAAGVLVVVASLTAPTLAAPAKTSARTAVVLDREGSGSTDNRSIGAVPDTSGAIGRRHYLEAVNSRIAIFDRKTLKLVRARDHFAFWGRSKQSGSLEDPQVAWDDGARRWYYSALFTGASGNRLLFAWTKHGDPADLSAKAWCRMSIPSGNFIDDYPISASAATTS